MPNQHPITHHTPHPPGNQRNPKRRKLLPIFIGLLLAVSGVGAAWWAWGAESDFALARRLMQELNVVEVQQHIDQALGNFLEKEGVSEINRDFLEEWKNRPTPVYHSYWGVGSQLTGEGFAAQWGQQVSAGLRMWLNERKVSSPTKIVEDFMGVGNVQSLLSTYDPWFSDQYANRMVHDVPGLTRLAAKALNWGWEVKLKRADLNENLLPNPIAPLISLQNWTDKNMAFLAPSLYEEVGKNLKNLGYLNDQNDINQVLSMLQGLDKQKINNFYDVACLYLDGPKDSYCKNRG